MTTVATATYCLLCGGVEPFDVGLCPGCGGGPPTVGNTLVFVQPAEADADRRRVADLMDRLLAGRTHLSERTAAAAGHRALLRVPAAGAHAVVTRLARHGIPAEARPANRTWATLPRDFTLLLGAIVLVGMLAGARAEPMLRWSSPLYALLLLLGAQVRLRLPAVRSSRRATFPVGVERALAEAFARLPGGNARELLVRLVRAAEPLHRVLRGRAVTVRRDVEDLVTIAAHAAEDLADLERGIDAVGEDERTARALALRDGLETRFRDGIATLHRLRAEAVADDPAHEELTRLVAALDDDADAYAAAWRELEALAP